MFCVFNDGWNRFCIERSIYQFVPLFSFIIECVFSLACQSNELFTCSLRSIEFYETYGKTFQSSTSTVTLFRYLHNYNDVMLVLVCALCALVCMYVVQYPLQSTFSSSFDINLLSITEKTRVLRCSYSINDFKTFLSFILLYSYRFTRRVWTSWLHIEWVLVALTRF